jgi:hypothetical protein
MKGHRRAEAQSCLIFQDVRMVGAMGIEPRDPDQANTRGHRVNSIG